MNPSAAELPEEQLSAMATALDLIERALEMLDQAGVPANIAAHLDLARVCIEELLP